MEKATEIFAALFLTVIGISHIAQPRAWVDFFVWLRGKGYAGVFVNGFLALSFGSLIVAFHNVWEGLGILLTLLGWAQVLKDALSFVAPQLGLWSLNKVSVERAWQFVVGGAFALVLSAVLWYVVFTH